MPLRWLSGGVSDKDRQATVDGFRRGDFSVLLTTDLAARGLDFPGVSVVFHLPDFRAMDDWAHCRAHY